MTRLAAAVLVIALAFAFYAIRRWRLRAYLVKDFPEHFPPAHDRLVGSVPAGAREAEDSAQRAMGCEDFERLTLIEGGKPR